MLRFLVLGGGALLIAGLLFAAPAFACGPSAYLQAQKSTGKANDSVTLIGSGYIGNSPVQAHWGGLEGPLLGSTTTNATGQFLLTVTIPADATPGQHVITTQQPGVEDGRTDIHFTFTVESPVVNEPPPTPTGPPGPGENPDPLAPPIGQPDATPPVIETPAAPANPAPDPAPVSQTPDPVTTGPLPAAAPAADGQAPAPAPSEPAPAATVRSTDATPVAAGPTTTTRSQTTTSTQAEDPAPSEAAPEGELVGVAADAYAPPAERGLFAGAGITAPEAPAPVPDAPAAENAASEPGGDDPVEGTDGGTPPWALVPLMLLAAGLLVASGAALTAEVRERAKIKVKI